MKVPSEVYTKSSRLYRGLGEVDYPFHDWTATVTHCGRICFKGRNVNPSQVFAGPGKRRDLARELQDYDLGYFDQ